MKKPHLEPLVSSEAFLANGLLTEKKVDQAIADALKKIDQNIIKLGNLYPEPNTKNNAYAPMKNTEWTNAFWSGVVWLAYEVTGDDKYRKLGEKHVEDFHQRVVDDVELDHHDLGFLYIPSCVSAYKLTGNELAKEAAILAADKLITRYQEKGQFIQAWGELGAKDNYRLIVDCLLNIPLLYWATDVTRDNKYRDIAEKHYQATVNTAIRDDASAFHTFYFDPETGEPVEGKTRQGYADDSSWARGQAWLVYGIALNHFYDEQDNNVQLFEAVTNYYLNRLPEDFVNYWDLIFSDGSGQSRDTSATAVAVCGLNLMDKYLPETNKHKHVYRYAQHAMLESLIDNYTELKTDGIAALVNSGVYSWHSGKGVDEGNIWGDYFYMEALVRFKKNWKMYW